MVQKEEWYFTGRSSRPEGVRMLKNWEYLALKKAKEKNYFNPPKIIILIPPKEGFSHPTVGYNHFHFCIFAHFITLLQRPLLYILPTFKFLLQTNHSILPNHRAMSELTPRAGSSITHTLGASSVTSSMLLSEPIHLVLYCTPFRTGEASVFSPWPCFVLKLSAPRLNNPARKSISLLSLVKNNLRLTSQVPSTVPFFQLRKQNGSLSRPNFQAYGDGVEGIAHLWGSSLVRLSS